MPSSDWACGRGSPVAPIVAASTVPRLRQLRLVLGEVRGHDPVTERDLARRGLALAEQRLEQRRLARAVRPDERDVLASLEHELGVDEQLLVARDDVEARRLEHDPARARGLEELEPERAVPARQRLQLAGGAFLRSFSRRPICVSFACACFALLFL